MLNTNKTRLIYNFLFFLFNFSYFILDNTPNNNTILQELSRQIGFDPKKKRLRYIGHVINLVTETYLFGQNAALFDNKLKKAGL
jgi:hypothetical protein